MRCLARWFHGSSSLLLLSLTGCTGFVGGERTVPVDAAGGSSTGAGTGTGTGGSATSQSGGSNCAEPSAPVLNARLLTPSQYEHSIEDMLKVADHPAKDFGGGVAARLDEVAVEQRANAAASVASKAAANLSAWSPCVPPAVEASTCAALLVEKLGRAAFRHPLSDLEKTQLRQLFDAGLAEKDFSTGVEWLLTGLLQAPDFLYQLAKPGAGELAGQVVALEAHELASRLAFFVWDSAPDEALLTAAGQGKLTDAQGLAAEAARMFGDPRFGRGTASFYANWLGLEGFKEVARDDPGLTTELLGTLESSLLMAATELYKSATPTLHDLFSGQSYFMNDKLRAFYGLSGGGPELAPVELPNEGRRGILTHPGLMTLLARPDHGDPIARGLFIQRTLLCFDIPPPPQGVEIPPLPPITPGLSTRARLEQHTVQPLCASCHTHIDPPGFALEAYDAVGRFRTMDVGVPVDTSGNMASGGDYDGPFASGGELLDRFAQSADVKACFAKHYLTFALARELGGDDECSLSRVASGFGQTGDLKELIVAIIKSDAFRLRKSEGAAP